MTFYLHLEREGYIAFEAEQCYMKFLVPKKLTSINEIISYDDGYLVIDTNYGEEYIDLNSIADEIDICLDFCNFTPMLRGGVTYG